MYNLTLPRYDAVVDVAPTVTWLLDTKYKDLKIVVEIDDIIDAEKACKMEFKRRHKALGTLRIVTDRGLQVRYSIISIKTSQFLLAIFYSFGWSCFHVLIQNFGC